MSATQSAICHTPALSGQAANILGSRQAGLGQVFESLLDTSGFPQRWHCGSWTASLGWLHIISDLAIFGAYLSIPLALLFFLARRRDLPFPKLILLFSAFILSCGIGHAIEALIFWHPVYRLAGVVKAITAVVSWLTVFATIRILPDALKLPAIARLNQRLRQEMDERILVEQELRRSETEARKLALVASRTHNAVILTDAHGNIEWINDGFTRITGYMINEVLGRTPGSLLQGPETDLKEVAVMRDCVRKGQGFHVELINYAKDGRKYWISIEAQPIHDEAGNLVHFMAIESDVTERKLAADTLRASEERFALAVRGTNEGIWDWDIVANRIYFSPRFAEFLGEEEREIEHTIDSFMDLVHPDDHDHVQASIYEHFHRRIPYDAEFRLRVIDNDYRWFHSRGQAIWDENGMAIRMVGSIGDITERKRTEQNLRLFQAAVEHAKDAILITEADPLESPGPRVVYVNPAFSRATGYEPEKILGETTEILERPGSDGASLEGVYQYFRERQPTRAELVNHRTDGSVYWVELNTWPVTDPSGQHTHWVAIQRDITAWKLAEQERQRLAEEELRESRQRLRDVINAAPIILFAIDSEGTVTLAKGRGLSALNLEAEAVIGRSAFEVFQGSRKMRNNLNRALAGDAFESVAIFGNRAFECRYTPQYHDWGTVSSVVCVATDITERARAQKKIRNLNVQLEQRLRKLYALRQIDVTISSSLDLHLTLGVVLDQVVTQLRVDAASVLLINPQDHTLSYVASKGFGNRSTFPTYLRPGAEYAGRVAREQALMAISELSQHEGYSQQPEFLQEERFVSYFGVPLMAKGQVRGVLEVYNRSKIQPDRDWTEFFEILAGQTAIAIDNATLFRDLQRSNAQLVAAYDATIEGWAHALDLRDNETEGHSRRVTNMTIELARTMGLDEAELVQVRRGALLHDIGKLGIPDAILFKAGPLTAEEREVMQRHPCYAHEWLSPVTFLRPALEIPYCHHEKWDGTGYPRGLKGKEIPLSARIFAIVDIWDALRSDRPYRSAWPPERVIEHIHAISGTHLDPEVVASFVKTFGPEGPK